MNFSRRQLLQTSGFGLGAIAAADLLAAEDKLIATERRTVVPDESNPLAVRPPHFPAKIKRVIHLFMNGGPSQIDTFDPKPELAKLDGQPLPDNIAARLQQVQRKRVGKIFASAV